MTHSGCRPPIRPLAPSRMRASGTTTSDLVAPQTISARGDARGHLRRARLLHPRVAVVLRRLVPPLALLAGGRVPGARWSSLPRDLVGLLSRLGGGSVALVVQDFFAVLGRAARRSRRVLGCHAEALPAGRPGESDGQADVLGRFVAEAGRAQPEDRERALE